MNAPAAGRMPGGRRAARRALYLAVGLAFLLPADLAAASGRLDRTFSRDGKVLTNLGSDEDWAYDVAIQPDGKVVAVGITIPGHDFPNSRGDPMFAITRYTSRGRLDRTFGGDGKVTVNFHPDPRDEIDEVERASAVAIQRDGKIVVAGYARDEGRAVTVAVARLTARGRLDRSFGGGDGKALPRPPCELCGGFIANEVQVRPDGRILLAGCARCGHDSEFLLLRLRRGGRLDPTFGNGGGVVTDVTWTADEAMDFAVRRDGRIVVTSYTFDLVRYRPNGRLDSSFGRGGIIERDLAYAAVSRALVLQKDGRIVVAGQVWDHDANPYAGGSFNFAVARFRPGGGLDRTFGGGDGLAVTDIGGTTYCEEDAARDVVVQRNGRILATGEACTPWRDFAAVRYRANGRLDRSFGRRGRVTTDMGSPLDWGEAAALRSGRLVVAGKGGRRTDFALARYRVD